MCTRERVCYIVARGRDQKHHKSVVPKRKKKRGIVIIREGAL